MTAIGSEQTATGLRGSLRSVREGIRGGLGWHSVMDRPETGEQPAPSVGLQVNALQALCRQVFGFRLGMITIAAPWALDNAAAGLATWLVGIGVTVTFMGSYALFRDWERFGPLLLRYPSLLVVDMFFAGLLLATAGPNSTLGFVSVSTPLLSGLAYGWRGAGVFTAIQCGIIFAIYQTDVELEATSVSTALLLPGFCVIAGAVGVRLRELMFRFGAAGQALTDAQARLAVHEALGEERARLAREMHDSVAKTLHGVALSADALADSAGRTDPEALRKQAELVSRSARKAAAESRELLSDLRRQTDSSAPGVDLSTELAARADDFAHRSGMATAFRIAPQGPVPQVPHAVARQLLAIAGEAMENAHRHAKAGRVTVEIGVVDQLLRLSVGDDGPGLPPGTTIDGLKRAGHFGLLGMIERAASIGARIRVGRGRAATGTEVRVDFRLAALPAPGFPDGTAVQAAAQSAPPAISAPPAMPPPPDH